MRTIAAPIAPKLLAKIDGWQGPASGVIELDNLLVRSKDLSGVRRLELEGCRLETVQLSSAMLDKMQVNDTSLSRVEAAGMRAPEAAWLRVACQNSRLTGVDFGAALLEDCLFENVKLDEAGLRFATLKRVRFENCNLRNVDFSGAKLLYVAFAGCELEGANFNNASCKSVDLLGENLSAIKGTLGLKGATVSSEQLIQLAPLLAAEVGLDVNYET